MVVSLLQVARRTPLGTGRHVAHQSARDVSRDCVRCDCNSQWHSQAISKIHGVPWLHAVCELFHHHDFPDPGASSVVDLGTPDRHCAVRRTDLAAIALRADAHPSTELTGPATRTTASSVVHYRIFRSPGTRLATSAT